MDILPTHASTCALCVCSAHGDQKGALDLQALELQMVVSCHLGVRNQSMSFVLKYQVSPQPQPIHQLKDIPAAPNKQNASSVYTQVLV